MKMRRNKYCHCPMICQCLLSSSLSAGYYLEGMDQRHLGVKWLEHHVSFGGLDSTAVSPRIIKADFKELLTCDTYMIKRIRSLPKISIHSIGSRLF